MSVGELLDRCTWGKQEQIFDVVAVRPAALNFILCGGCSTLSARDTDA
jgi:hypothetical protein